MSEAKPICASCRHWQRSSMQAPWRCQNDASFAFFWDTPASFGCPEWAAIVRANAAELSDPAPQVRQAEPRDDYGASCRTDLLRQFVSDINTHLPKLRGNQREAMLNVVRRVSLKAGVPPNNVGLP
jgi:hypothetical protein